MNARKDILKFSSADERWIAKKVASGEYRTRHEAIADAVKRARSVDHVDDLLLEGLRSPKEAIDEAWKARLKNEVRERRSGSRPKRASA